MNYFLKIGYIALAFIILVSCATPKGTTKQEKKSFVQNMHDETLAKLYTERPETKSVNKNAAGYAVFKNKVVFNDFIEKGWEFGGSADATAKSGEKGEAIGGEAYFEDDIIIYQMTEAGVALQATISGTKYQKDSDLN